MSTYSLTVRVTDNVGATSDSAQTLNLALGLSGTLPSGTANTPYAQSLAAGGGTPPFAWSISVGSLPTGLTIDADSGVISGTPTVAGSSTFTVTVQDSVAATASSEQTVVIA